ncbi:ubiquitin carboxyl-terminal hydrolase 4-like [Halichondria panicea]|uniref:ubiquitin carboxyl-terminal hydrolase 4-like n=1 Tax=Halichondria panicea TaxID=6063 RepID=UPI00312B8525
MSTEDDPEPMDTGQTTQEAPKSNLSVVLEILEVVLDKWYEIGTDLKVDASILHILDKEFRNVKTTEEKNVRIQRILIEWAGREGVEMVELMNAVRACDEGVADRLQVMKDILPVELIQAQVKGEPDKGTEVKEEGNKEQRGDGDEVNQEGGEGGKKEKEDDAAMDVKVEGNKEKDGDAEMEVKGEGNKEKDDNDAVDVKVEDPPDIETQRKEIQAALKQQLKNGQVWFLVDIRWMKQWKKYVGYDMWDQSSAGKESSNPGPIDNSNLFKDDSLREHLMDELDYYLIPESAWNKLSKWYNHSSGSKVISRRAVEYGLYMKHCKVEVYLLEFKICIHPNLNDIKKREFSRADTVADLEAAIQGEFQIPSDTECRVWHRYMTHTYELLSNPDQSLQDAGLYNGQTIVLEKKNEDGSWPRATSTVSSTTHSTRSSDNIGSSSTRSGGSSSYGSYGNSGSYWSSYNNQPTDPGLCGLSNLGNTCFMNSALQCLSNTAPLTEYFLGTEAGYKPYKKHINADNPLGMGGAIAEAYGALLEDIWSGKCSVAAPRQFKTSVGRYAPQFVGYAQHDSQELLAFLLDGLHEDLNLIKKKPYVDMTVATKGRDEKEIAEETWYKYLQRNQSVIVKLFQAQLRSTLICPKCTNHSLTFDPFMFLSLPLPVKNTRTVCVRLVCTNPTRPITKYKLKIPKRGTIWQLKEKLSQLCDIEASHLAVVDVYNGRFHRIYADKDPLTHIMEKDDIFCYQLEKENIGNRKMVHVPVYMRTASDKQYSSSSRYYTLFGLPTVAYVPAECTYRTLYTAIVSKMGKCVKLWSEVKDEVKASTDNNHEDMEREGNENGDNENGNGNGNGDENGTKATDNESSADPPPEVMDVEEATNNEEKSEEVNKDKGERDLFRLMVVNSYGSQDIKKLTDDPKKTLLLSGSTYIACDWEEEVREKCYNEDMSKKYNEHESCHDDPIAKGKNIQLMDCFELFTVKETLGKDDEWYCPECKEHVQASKKFDLWTLPDVLVIHLKRFSYDKYWRDKLDVLVDFPVSGLDLSSLVRCPDAPEPVYDLYAVSNHFGGMGGGHYTAYAKNKNNKKWYNFDDSHVSETTEDRLVSSAAYVLYYRRRDDQSRPTRRSILDRSLSQSFAEEDRELKEKYQKEKEDQESKRSRNESEVFSEADEDNQATPSNQATTSTSMDEPD